MDIAYYKEEAIGIFRQQADGTFHVGESRDLSEKKRRPRTRFLQFDVPPRVADFNGDGLLDVALVYPRRAASTSTSAAPAAATGLSTTSP
jgi:hypothetical protein